MLLAESGSARWWDTDRRELVAPPTVGPVTWLGFRPDGSTLVTVGAGDPAAVVWDLPRAQARPRLPAARADRRSSDEAAQTVTDAPWTVALTGGLEAPVRVWDVAADRPAPVPLRLLGRKVFAVAAAPDGRQLAAALQEADMAVSEVYVWDAATGRPTARLPHDNWVRGMAFTPDGRTLVTGGYDRHLHAWDPETGRRCGAPTYLIETTASGQVRDLIVRGVAIGPNGRSVAISRTPGRRVIGPAVLSLGADPTAPDAREVWADANGPPAEVVQFTRDGGHVFGFSSSDVHAFGHRAPVSRWDSRTGERAGTPVMVHRLRTAAVADDGTTALVGSGDGIARCWNLETGGPAGPPLAHPSAVNACFLLLAHGLAVCGCDDGSARVWDLRTGRAVGPPLTHGPALTAVAVGPDGRCVRTVAADGSARTWEVPGPTAGAPDAVRRAVSYRTGLALDPGQRVVPLEAAGWTTAPAVDISDGALAAPAWHERGGAGRRGGRGVGRRGLPPRTDVSRRARGPGRTARPPGAVRLGRRPVRRGGGVVHPRNCRGAGGPADGLVCDQGDRQRGGRAMGNGRVVHRPTGRGPAGRRRRPRRPRRGPGPPRGCERLGRGRHPCGRRRKP
ncbi:WD40 repeat domain-containing protein [Frigoriglobus tundricola]|uniref:WD40 repeat domain-containing protein n=1 Tax=Frigoriglobus tundricola TaxID=2774151 RepID=UPI00148EA37F|nr:hypothetical protein [Frigoriglobus tundricola]